MSIHFTHLATVFAMAVFVRQAAAAPCLVMPIKEQAEILVGEKSVILDPKAGSARSSLELRRCEQVKIVAGRASVALKDEKRGWLNLVLESGQALTPIAISNAKALASSGGGLAQLWAILRGDSGSQYGLSRGEPAVAGMPFGKVLRPADTWILAIAHATPQTLMLTPPLTARRQPLTLAIAAGEAARIPADFLVPGGIYRWRLERDGKAHEGRFQMLDAESQSAIEKSLAAIGAESPEHLALLRSLQLDAAGLEYDRDRALVQP